MSTIQETVIRQGIARDAAYAGCVVRDLNNKQYAAFGPITALCMAPYLSLFLHESYRKLEAIDPALARLLSDDVRSIVERSRHSLKLFEDTHRGIDGQIEYFRDDIMPAHHSYFFDLVWFPPARRFAKDLGFFRYDKRMVANTHGLTFHMGIGAGQQLAMRGGEIQAVYKQYGDCFRHLGARIDSVTPTFISSLDAQLFGPLGDDARAESYYASVFDGASNPYLNAVLTVFRGMMNFVNAIMLAGTDDLDYTEFKIRFLTLYAILGSLLRLKNEQQHDLTNRSVLYIDAITGTAEAQLILARFAKPFRNTLMHYNLVQPIDVSRIDVIQPLFGLVPIYFPSHGDASFLDLVNRCINETTEAMEAWAGI